MRILYLALDQTVPGTKGGSIHVQAVAQGLSRLGHDVHVLATPASSGAFPSDLVRWQALQPPLGMRQLRILRSGRVHELATAIQPDVIMERYYNFGGEGVRAARATGAALVLEVNAPMIDYSGSPKQWLDRALLVEPLRRWREWQAHAADLIVTPSTAIVARDVPRERILEIEWGADTARFHPGAPGAVPFSRREGETLAVFAGAFRGWHGAVHLIEAIRILRQRKRRDIGAVLIGDGPELARVRRAADGMEGVVFTGAVSHDCMPACLAAADIGVAPFDVSAHAPLRLDFYWSPLKIFEYMAAGLPVVAPDIPRLRRLVAHEREGLLYNAANPDGLAAAIERLAGTPTASTGMGNVSGGPGRSSDSFRTSLGAAARARAVCEYGWDVHCQKLDEALRRLRSVPPKSG